MYELEIEELESTYEAVKTIIREIKNMDYMELYGMSHEQSLKHKEHVLEPLNTAKNKLGSALQMLKEQENG